MASFNLYLQKVFGFNYFSYFSTCLPWDAPKERCDGYGYCGSFGICIQNSPEVFSWKCAFPYRTDSNDLVGRCVTCVTNTKLQFDLKNKEFLSFQNTKLATGPTTSFVTTTTVLHVPRPVRRIVLARPIYAYDGKQYGHRQ